MNKFTIIFIIAVIASIGIYFIAFKPVASTETSTLSENTPVDLKPISKTQPVNNEERANEIQILDFEFSPAVISIPTNTKITWRNIGKLPQVVKSEEFESPVLLTEDEYSYTFTQAGVYTYVSDVRKFGIINGTINVQ